MNQRESALFLAFCFYLLNVSLANDVQRAILLSSIVQIRALQAQVMLNQQQRRCRGRRFPRFWALPRPDQSWFEIHYFDAPIPGDYFSKQLRLNRDTFTVLLNLISRRLTRQNTYLRDCVTPEKILALGLYCLAHGNSYVTRGKPPSLRLCKVLLMHCVT